MLRALRLRLRTATDGAAAALRLQRRLARAGQCSGFNDWRDQQWHGRTVLDPPVILCSPPDRSPPARPPANRRRRRWWDAVPRNRFLGGVRAYNRPAGTSWKLRCRSSAERESSPASASLEISWSTLEAIALDRPSSGVRAALNLPPQHSRRDTSDDNEGCSSHPPCRHAGVVVGLLRTAQCRRADPLVRARTGDLGNCGTGFVTIGRAKPDESVVVLAGGRACIIARTPLSSPWDTTR